MKKILVASLLGCLVCSGADVFSNVYFYSRGFGTDLDGDGKLDVETEGRDSLNGGYFAYDGVIGWDSLRFTNEWAHLPYRGTTNYVQSLYLRQGKHATGNWDIPVRLRLKNETVCAITEQTTANYTIFVRFRPDLTQPGGNSPILWFGNNSSNKRGVMIMLNNNYWRDDATTTLCVFYGLTSWYPPHDNYSLPVGNADEMRVSMGQWNDLVFSIKGKEMRVLLSRAGGSPDARHTFYDTKTLALGEHNLVPQSGAQLILGMEESNKEWYSMGSRFNAFRGSIQTLALWTNSMTEAEMRTVAAYPRMDRWRLGVENGTASEFGTAAVGAAVDVEGDTWAVPALAAANDSFTIRFPLDASGDAQMNEFVRIKGVDGGASAVLKVAVNGVPCTGVRAVKAGQWTSWFVPAESLLANATNEVVVTRVDAGDAFTFDVAAFGGSVQYGEDNGGTSENGSEWAMQNREYDLIGANWMDGTRALFGGGGDNPQSAYTNQLVRFSIPEDLQDDELDYRLTVRTTSEHRMVIFFNDEKIEPGASCYGARTYNIPAQLLRVTNEVNIINDEDYNGSYTGIDFMRFNVQEPPAPGTVMLLR